MGCDGTEGLRTIKQQGGYTIAQDEETCLIFGMPRSAIAGEVVDKVVPLSEVAREITTWCQLSSR
jgi:two-component system chemotaxis response regulator CheB